MDEQEIRENIKELFRRMDKQGNRLTAMETGCPIVHKDLATRMEHIYQKTVKHEDRLRSLEDSLTRVVVKMSLIGGGIYVLITILSKWLMDHI